MLSHIQIPFLVFFVSIGKFSDLCHQTHFGLYVTTKNISAWISSVSILSRLIAIARAHGTVILCPGDKISARDSEKYTVIGSTKSPSLKGGVSTRMTLHPAFTS